MRASIALTPGRRGAGAGINRLAKKYLGVEEYPYRAPGQRRVQFRVR